MRAELTSAEIAMSGSYFDDVLRDPRRYGIKNTTDKVRRPAAVRRRRDAVCTERVVGKPEVCHVISVDDKSLMHLSRIEGIGWTSSRYPVQLTRLDHFPDRLVRTVAASAGQISANPISSNLHARRRYRKKGGCRLICWVRLRYRVCSGLYGKLFRSGK
jgi:hypothetical protein